ncbi:MAG TPA: hypothetical protein VIQ31_16300, partial [Phormidium sp.]
CVHALAQSPGSYASPQSLEQRYSPESVSFGRRRELIRTVVNNCELTGFLKAAIVRAIDSCQKQH